MFLNVRTHQKITKKKKKKKKKRRQKKKFKVTKRSKKWNKMCCNGVHNEMMKKR